MCSVLVLGSGAREHAISCSILKSQNVEKVFVYPGNDGIFLENNIERAEISNYKDNLIEFCKNNNISLVIIGSETLLVEGLSDFLNKNSINCLGPDKKGAIIEGSKSFSKNFMRENNIPTANYKIFKSYNNFQEYYETKIQSQNKHLVVKASGLAAGKGVILPENDIELEKIVKEMLLENKFGEASNEIILEERLEGIEVSIMGFCNGNEISLMPQSQDYKKIYDNNQGLNTGGMGSHAPVCILDDDELEFVKNNMLKVVRKLDYRGILYAGIMKTKDNIFFLEFNCRLGDPEAQVLLTLLDNQKSDLYSICISCLNGSPINAKWRSGYASNIVLSHTDYPVSKSTEDLPMIIDFDGLKKKNIDLYWSNITVKNNQYFTKGGRVVSMVRYSNTFLETFSILYNNTGLIKYNNKYYRRDIGLNSTYLKNDKKEKKLKIGILGSTRGSSLEKLIRETKNNNINASIEIIISNNKSAFILNKGEINSINNMFLSSKNQTKEDYDRKIVNLFRIFEVDLVLLVGYMKIVSPILINEYKGNIINIHPSLLPDYGGKMDLDVHQEVLNNNEKFTGCTVHHVIEEVDGGDIILQKQLLIETDNPKLLKVQVQKLEEEALVDVVNMFLMHPITYKNSGVDIEEGNNLVSNIKEISDNIGGFSALYKYHSKIPINNIVLGSATDGVGTKLEVAIKMRKFDTIGIDLVAMSVNDLIACGIRPLFFLDYLAIDKMDAVKCKTIIDGINKGCSIAKCQLVGGETAEMNGIYFKDKFDMAGFAVGIQEYVLNPLVNISEENYIYGIKSSGIHSNGYTLVNKLLKFSNYNLEAILEPTRIYIEVLDYLEKYKDNIKGISHITGGGFKDNINRILPKDLTYELKEWDMPDIFKWIQKTANIDKEEMLNTFNCGYGMVLITDTRLEIKDLELIGKIKKK